jgi:cytochrome c oxidase cbb3-type subunit 3
VSTPPGQTRVTGTDTISTQQLGAVVPGIHPNIVYGSLRNPYAGDAGAREEGRRLFVAYNCSGCHGGRAGGGMGPSLRDSLWTYGREDTQLYSTIVEGRPAGMPAWGAMLSQDQIWKLITYIRSLRTLDEPDQVSVK